jgi:hypothetical protein
MLSKELLDIIVCPKCKGSLILNETNNSLSCQKCKLRYPITNGIPELLLEKAEPIQEE